MSYKLVMGEDWVGLYHFNGNLLAEGHSLSETRMLDALGIDYDYVEGVFEDGDRCEPTFAKMIARTGGPS